MHVNIALLLLLLVIALTSCGTPNPEHLEIGFFEEVATERLALTHDAKIKFWREYGLPELALSSGSSFPEIRMRAKIDGRQLRGVSFDSSSVRYWIGLFGIIPVIPTSSREYIVFLEIGSDNCTTGRVGDFMGSLGEEMGELTLGQEGRIWGETLTSLRVYDMEPERWCFGPANQAQPIPDEVEERPATTEPSIPSVPSIKSLSVIPDQIKAIAFDKGCSSVVPLKSEDDGLIYMLECPDTTVEVFCNDRGCFERIN